MHKFPYRWTLKDARFTKDKGKVFSCFACGGGSTMGYKLAGFDVIGCNEIDPRMNKVYVANHHPRLNYLEPIQEFKLRKDLPAELYNLDILDGSPPCSTFSTAGSRDDAWGKEKQFAEGQKMQRLDDLVFVYCDTIEKLKPKVCWLENVSGLVKGNAKVYAKKIVKRLNEIGYNVQVFLLNGATMGVPQIRERSFFIGLRKDFHLPKLVLNFNEAPILFKEIKDASGEPITGEKTLLAWKNRRPTDEDLADTNIRVLGKESNFNTKYAKDNQILKTITASAQMILYSDPVKMSTSEMLKAATFPIDYQAPNERVLFLTGMSVAPLMSAQISYQIYKQWLSKINK